MIKKVVTTELDENGEAFIKMENFKDIFDLEKVCYYDVQKDGEQIVIRFYDGNKKIIKPKKP